MMLILGAAMLIAAALVLVLAHVALNRPSASRAPDVFGWGEATAFLFTVLVSGGVAALGSQIVRDVGLATIGGAVGAVAASAVVGALLWAVLRRFVRRSEAPLAPLLSQGRRGRPGPDGRPAGTGAGARRKAA